MKWHGILEIGNNLIAGNVYGKEPNPDTSRNFALLQVFVPTLSVRTAVSFSEYLTTLYICNILHSVDCAEKIRMINK
jgi:hypothetical protein